MVPRFQRISYARSISLRDAVANFDGRKLRPSSPFAWFWDVHSLFLGANTKFSIMKKCNVSREMNASPGESPTENASRRRMFSFSIVASSKHSPQNKFTRSNLRSMGSEVLNPGHNGSQVARHGSRAVPRSAAPEALASARAVPSSP